MEVRSRVYELLTFKLGFEKRDFFLHNFGPKEHLNKHIAAVRKSPQNKKSMAESNEIS